MVNEIEHGAKMQHITVAELCRRAGVANSTLTRWKMGKTNPNYATVERFKAALAEVEKGQRPC